jgi:hypothetical protein
MLSLFRRSDPRRGRRSITVLRWVDAFLTEARVRRRRRQSADGTRIVLVLVRRHAQSHP